MRVFVTGGTGFLGKRVVRRLVADGHDVVCLVRPGGDADAFRASVAGGAPQRVHVVQGSLERITAAVDATGGCDVVVHVAAAMVGGSAVLFLNNVVAMRQLIAAVPRMGAKRFVLVSSLGVYGTSGLKQWGTLDESCPLDPSPHLRDPYSYSKIAQEHVAWEAHAKGELPLVVIRPAVIYGPGKNFLSARVGLQVGRLMIKMGGRQRVPYTYVENCADAIALAVTAPGVEGQAFNIVDDTLPTASSLLRLYRREVDRLRVIPIPRVAIGPLSGMCEWYHRWSRGQLPAVLTRYKSAAQWKPLRYSNARAKTVLGWAPKVGFAEGLRESAAWAKSTVKKPATAPLPVPTPTSRAATNAANVRPAAAAARGEAVTR
jgi:nucleoside-diphosphate-sugar epimerase